MSEKRTNRLDVPRQLRVGESMGRLIREMADRERRTIQQQMVVLIAKGIETQYAESSKEEVGRIRQILSGERR